MKFQLGLEDFLNEEQKQLLLDLHRLMPRAAKAMAPAMLSEWGVADDICRAFTMSVMKDIDRGVLEEVDDPIVTIIKEDLKRPQEMRVSSAGDQYDESAECIHENMPETKEEGNIIPFKCKNREE